jgi:hypothetical protein
MIFLPTFLPTFHNFTNCISPPGCQIARERRDARDALHKALKICQRIGVQAVANCDFSTLKRPKNNFQLEIKKR